MAGAQVTPQQFANWIPVHVALSRVQEGIGDASAPYAILGRLQAGLLRSATNRLIDASLGSEPIVQGLTEIDALAWNDLHGEDFWQTETAEFLDQTFGKDAHYRTVRFFNVRFEPAGLAAMIPRQPRSGPHEGGRPRKDYWDDLWIEICRQLYLGELEPKLQVDIEKAMLAWAAKHGHAMSVASARPRARDLFAVLPKKDKN